MIGYSLLWSRHYFLISKLTTGTSGEAASQYGTEVCPTNSADRHSLQFTVNKMVYKIFGAMSMDLYIEISAHFGIESVENLIADRRNRFINRYGEADNYLCQMLRWLVQFVWLYILFIVFVYFRLLNFSFFHLCCATTYVGEIKLYI